jgi:5'-3' exoribonuclease 1
VDRVLKKFGKAQVMGDDEGDGFRMRYERSMKEKMDGWKRGYYRVG